MSQATIEERVTRLEQLVDQLLQGKPSSAQPGRDDWKKTFGMFAGDPVMKEIIEAGERIRQLESIRPGPLGE
jgi:hypothetical protein